MATTPGTDFLADGSLDWSAGVDSSKVPTIRSTLNLNGLARNQLSWLNNATVRGGRITQRAGWQPLIPALAEGGRWQGGFIYEPDGANPYLVCQISGILYSVLLESPYTVTDLTGGDASLWNPTSSERAYFCQAENYLIVQAGDYYLVDEAERTLPLFWDGFVLRRSIGITTATPASRSPGINEIPPATCMDYYGGRLWYAQGRQYSAGDIVGGPSGTELQHYRDAVLSVTENPLCFGGDGFTVPTQAGNIRALKHSANLNASLGEGQLFIFTRRTIYSISVPITRTDWIAADADNQPQQTVVQLVNGSVNDKSVVSVNGDLFYQSFDPAIRSLISAVRYFQQWGNTPISQNEQRALQGNDRGLMRFSSGIFFDNRMLQLVLPQVSADGLNVIHRAILPLDFDTVTSLTEQTPIPAWEGAWDGLQFLELFEGDFGGRQRAFAAVISDVDGSIAIWELTVANRVENGDNRVTWSAEFPAWTWAEQGLELKLKELRGGEMWLDSISGTVDIDVYYREDADPCWRRWLHHQVCAGRAEDVSTSAYPVEPFRTGYAIPITFPVPKASCDAMRVRTSNIGYQFQVKVVLRGYARILGLFCYALPHSEPAYRFMACAGAIPQGMAKLPVLEVDGTTCQVVEQVAEATLPGNPDIPLVPPVQPEAAHKPAKATSPSPANGSTDILTPILSWSEGGGTYPATSYNVYFNGVFQGNQVETTWDPGDLANSTTYTWRIDAVNDEGTTTGTTWSFTTGVYIPFSYSQDALPIDWIDGAGAHSGDLFTFNATADPDTVTSLTFPENVLITSIVGLGSLPALQSITCKGTAITALDLHYNAAIQTVDCSDNASITSLDVTGCSTLTTLDCSGCTTLADLDLTGCTGVVTVDAHSSGITTLLAAGCSAMTSISCYDCASMTTLNLTGCTALQTISSNACDVLASITGLATCTSVVTLTCSDCALTSLDVHTLTHMTTLQCGSNTTLISLSVTGCTSLFTLNCANSTALAFLNVTGCTSLFMLDCKNCALTSLDCSTATSLNSLLCSGNTSLTSLTLPTNLLTLSCYNCALTTIDVTALTSIDAVECGQVTLTTFTAAGCTTLTDLDCNGSTSLTSLNVSGCTSLYALNLASCALTTLNCSGLSTLGSLTLTGNPLVTLNVASTALTSLDVTAFASMQTLTATNCASMTSLTCSLLTNLTSLDVAGCTALTSLNCNRTAITSLDVHTCTLLQTLSFAGNEWAGPWPIATVDASGLTHLTSVDVSYQPNITSIDVGGATALLSLNATNCNDLVTLDVLGCSSLTTLTCTATSLTTLTVTGLTSLTTLTCHSNASLTTIADLDDCTALVTLDAHSSGLTALTLTGLTALVTLNCQSNASLITITDLDDCTALVTLNTNSCAVGSLNVTGFTSLTTLNCGSNTSLTTITNILNCTALVTLNVSSTGIVTLDVGGLTALTTLTITNCTSLTDLTCDGCTALTGLTVTGCSVLDGLDCNGSTSLTAINTTGCTALVDLDCHGCSAMTSITLTGCTALQTLTCYSCNIHYLVLTGLTALQTLDFHSNGAVFTVTDIDTCTALVTLNCYLSAFTDLDLSGLTNLQTVDCHGCTMTGINLWGCTALTSIDCNACTSLILLRITGCTALTTCYAYDCSALYQLLDPDDCTSLVNLDVHSCFFDADGVRDILCELVTAGAVNGTFDGHNNAIPTASSCPATLVARGWTLTLDS